jgi:NAD(P)-dependent dehydrogenase (short-subunit alcohol dehydrogenase family)
MTKRLEGHHILVTGGSQGIGAAIVEKALAEGARVSFIDLKEVRAQELIQTLNASDRCAFEQGDVCKADDIARAHDKVVTRFGAVTGLVNNAGKNAYFDPVKMTEAEWDDVFSVDLKAAWLVARAVLPGMIAAGRGSIVNIASIHAKMTFPSMFPYAAAKSGLVGFTRSLALEVGSHQVRVNALSPGYTETALVKEFFELQGGGMREKVLDVHPMHRMAKPSEIASCVCFLLSDEASFVTGANWDVDGGLTARFAS